MDLNILWFLLIAVLYIGFFVLEGFDFGVGMLMPYLSRDDTERRAIINTIGPHWDGNEVWLLTAGGATFAAFPQWYATLFSGFYLPLFLLLMALILRGVAFEFRSKDDNPTWRKAWDWAIFLGSGLSALLLGVAFANLARGVPINAKMQYIGGFFNLLNPYALIGGITTIAIFLLHGALFLTLKTTGEVLARAKKVVNQLWLPAAILVVLLLAFTFFETDILSKTNIIFWIAVALGLAAILLAGFFMRKGQFGKAFAMTALTIAGALVTLFAIMFPRVMISSIDPAYSMTIYSASSTSYTLGVMSIVALIFVPFVLLYQGWSYWVFRKRVSARREELTY